MPISLTEVAQRVEKAGANATERIDEVLAKSGNAQDAVTALGATLLALQQKAQATLPLLTGEAAQLKSDLEKSRKDVDAGFEDVEQKVAALKALLEKSGGEAETRFKALNKVTGELTDQVKAVEDFLEKAQATQRDIVESGLARIAEEQQALKKAVTQASNEVGKLQKGVDQAKVSEAGQVQGLADALAAALVALKADLGRLETDGGRAVAEFEHLLGELVAGTLHPALTRIEQFEQQTVDDVKKRTTVAVQRLDDDGLVKMASQARSTEARLSEKQRPLDQANKTLRDGPQLKPLLVASRDVLKRIGKIALLGPLASGL